MVGITRGLFVPLSLAVGFSMIASTTLSSTLVPIMAVWILKPGHKEHGRDFVDVLKDGLAGLLHLVMPLRLLIVPVYVIVAGLVVFFLYQNIAKQLFPDSASDQFRVRITAPTGMRVEALEKRVLKTIEEVKAEVGPENVEKTLGYAGQQPPFFPISSAFLWTAGPHQALLDVQLKEAAHINVSVLKDRLRERFHKAIPDTQFSFEPGDIVSQIMNLGSPTPLAIRVSGHDLIANKTYANKVMAELRKIPELRDLQWGQPLDYPTVQVNIDRELAGQQGTTPQKIGMALQPAYFSSRFVNLSLWRDAESGFSYQLQVQVPQDQIRSKADIENFPAMPDTRQIQMDHTDGLEDADIAKMYPGAVTRRRQHPLISDVAKVEYGVTNGEMDRYNMMRMVSLTANLAGNDLGRAGDSLREAVRRAGRPPAGVFADVTGQVPLLEDTLFHLLTGLVLAVVVITLMMLAYFQVARVVLIVMSTTPAILLGVLTMLTVTGTTVNIQSFMGAIMSIGVGIANAILLVVFAEESRREGMSAVEAAIHGAQSRMRPILMTSIAMVTGMIPMALSGGQSAPLGRAVIGGLVMSTTSVLTLLPLVFAIIQNNAPLFPRSLHPEDKDEPTK
jgi:multidrug efflux pump subunit AcrB